MNHQQQRLTILKCLYSARESAPKQGWVERIDLTQLAGECEFAISYLIEKAHIKREGFRYRITATGIDMVEAAQDD